jgi:anti-anti-sigma factor
MLAGRTSGAGSITPFPGSAFGERSALFPLPKPRQLLETEWTEGRARVVVHDPHLDTVKALAVGDYLLALAGKLGRGRLELDLGNVRYLCVTCLGKLIALDRRLRATGGHLTLLDVPAAVYEVFEVTHLTTVLDLHEAA